MRSAARHCPAIRPPWRGTGHRCDPSTAGEALKFRYSIQVTGTTGAGGSSTVDETGRISMNVNLVNTAAPVESTDVAQVPAVGEASVLNRAPMVPTFSKTTDFRCSSPPCVMRKGNVHVTRREEDRLQAARDVRAELQRRRRGAHRAVDRAHRLRQAPRAAAQVAREKEEAAEREAALEVERKAARDARYAARKKKKK